VGVSGHEAYKLHDKPIFLGSLGTTLLCLGNVGVLQVWYDIWDRFFVPPHPNQSASPEIHKIRNNTHVLRRCTSQAELEANHKANRLGRNFCFTFFSCTTSRCQEANHRLTGSDGTFVSSSSSATLLASGTIRGHHDTPPHAPRVTHACKRCTPVRGARL
jgi:hypothetical protein